MALPVIVWVLGGVVATMALAVAIDEINDHLEKAEIAKARAKVAKIKRKNDGELSRVYAKYREDMSPATRRLFREAMR